MLDQNIHRLNACEELTDTQILQICLALDVDKCVKDTAELTYYFYLKK